MVSNIDGLHEAGGKRGESHSQPDSQPGTGTTGASIAADGPGLTDEQLEEIITDRETNITVVGCGGGGCNTVHRMEQEGIHGADLVAANTDVQHLTAITADAKLLIGQNQTEGKGTGSIPQIGEQAALEDEAKIEATVAGSDMVFVTAGLGGGTGTGAAPVVAKQAKQAEALTVAIVTMPFTAEGEVRQRNAEVGLDRLRSVADTVIVIPNDRLLDSASSLPVRQAFKVADEVLMRAVKGITELITRSQMVNLDFSDVETVMQSGGVAMIGFGESDSDNKAQAAVRSAINSPLLDVDISGAGAALVNVTGGPGMSIDEAEGVVEEIYDRVDPEARIIWGTGIDESLDETIRAMIVVTDVSSPQVFGQETDEEAEPEHDIDHVV